MEREEALRGGPGPFALQATIATVHCQAQRAEDTDWSQIVQLYTVLSRVMGLNEPTLGGVILAKREVSGPDPDRGVVFQSPALLLWRTARDNVRLAIAQVQSRQRRAVRERLAEHYLALVHCDIGMIGSSLRSCTRVSSIVHCHCTFAFLACRVVCHARPSVLSVAWAAMRSARHG